MPRVVRTRGSTGKVGVAHALVDAGGGVRQVPCRAIPWRRLGKEHEGSSIVVETGEIECTRCLDAIMAEAGG